MVESAQRRIPTALLVLLLVQLLKGIVLTPLSNFFSIYLNESLMFSLGQVAQVIALGQVIGMVASIVGGGMSDRLGHKWVLVLGVGGLGVGGLLFLFEAPLIVIAMWGIASAGLGLSTVSSQGYLTLAAAAGTLGLSSAFYNWGYTVGGAVGAPIGASILGEDNFSALGLALVALGIVATLVTIGLPNLRPPLRKRKDVPEADGYLALVRQPRIFILGTLRFLPTCYYGLMTLLPLLIKQEGGDNQTVATYIAVSSVAASLTQLVAGRTADRWGVRLPTVISFAAIVVATVGTIVTAPALWGLLVFGTIGISAAWALSTLLPGMVTLAAEPQVHGRVFGMLHMLWTLAMICGTLLGGALLEVNLQLPFVIVGVLVTIALFLTVPFFRLGEAKAKRA